MTDKIWKHIFSATAKIITIVLLIGISMTVSGNFHERLPSPLQIPNVNASLVDERYTELREIINNLGCPEKIQHKMTLGILNGADHIDVDPVLIAALIRTESDFRLSAESEKGYKGLMQTPVATKQWIDVDILIGCKILKEKLGYAKGDMRFALALYKGGNNPMAKRQADQVIKLYRSLKG